MKGIVNPWAVKPVASEAPSPAPRSAQDPHLRSFDEVTAAYVTMEGRRFKLLLSYLPCKDRDKFDDAAENFGECLKKVFAKSPENMKVFREYALHLEKPTGPKILLRFGELTLYARASSQDIEAAFAMAVDRLCMALTTIKGRDFSAKRTLDDFNIIISNKT